MNELLFHFSGNFDENLWYFTKIQWNCHWILLMKCFTNWILITYTKKSILLKKCLHIMIFTFFLSCRMRFIGNRLNFLLIKKTGDFTQVEIYNWLGTAPVPPGGCRYWHCTGIIPGGKRLGTGIRPKCHSAGSCLSVLARY